MFFNYIWQAIGVNAVDAHRKFARILERQRELYASAWGFLASITIHQQGDTLIGQLYHDPGIIGWEPWTVAGDRGLAWDGVCEKHLGTRFDSDITRRVVATLAQSPRELRDWDGNFSVISWDDTAQLVNLTTGATQSPTLWYTEGPSGWAAGSRGAPLLEMTSQRKIPSAVACNINLAYGYNYSNLSLYDNVRRVPQRSQISIRPSAPPVFRTYASIRETLLPDPGLTDRREILDLCADRLVTRIRRQIDYSTNPEVLITGGRDSRCILAAARQAGYTGTASTGGSAHCKDVLIGKAVTEKLGYVHRHTEDRVPLDRLVQQFEQLILWSTMSEGVEILRHVRAFNSFVEGHAVETERQQLIHGLGGEISRGYYYHNADDLEPFSSGDYRLAYGILLSAANPGVPISEEAKLVLQNRWDNFSEDLGTDRLTVAQWLDLFFWQNSCLRWGGDMLSVKSPRYWIWTPLIDRRLISAYPGLSPEDKRSDRFVEDLTLQLASELEGTRYDTDCVGGDRKSAGRRLINRLCKTFYSKLPQPGGENKALVRLWSQSLLEVDQPVWKNCLDESGVKNLIREKPASEILWNAATIQLAFARAA